MELKLKNNNKLEINKYILLDYIEASDGDFHITIPQKTIALNEKFVWKFKSGNSLMLGWQNQDMDNEYQIFVSANKFYFDYRGRINGGTFTSNTEYYLEIGNKYIKNLTTGTNIISGPTTTQSVTPKDFQIQTSAGGRFYSFKDYVGDELIHELLPVIYNGIVCVYDTISDTFFYNNGSGNAVAGPMSETQSRRSLPDDIKLKITSIFHQNTPNVKAFSLIKGVVSYQKTHQDEVILLNRIRADIGNVEGSLSDLMELAGMAGFNDNYEPQAKPRLVGTYTINDWYTQEQLAEAQAAFDGLTITPDANYLIDFNEMAVQVLDSTKPNYNPAASVYLKSIGKGVTLPEPLVENGGRWFITYQQALQIKSISFSSGSLDDTYGIAPTSYTPPSGLNFPELRFFGISSAGPGIPSTAIAIYLLWFPNRQCTYSNYQHGYPSKLYTYGTTLTITQIRGHGLSELHYYGTWDEWASRNWLARSTYHAISNFAYNCPKVYFNDELVNIATISNKVTALGNCAFEAFNALKGVHLEMETPPTLGSSVFADTSFKIYVGDGSSAEHDDAILADYLADTNWATYSSRLDTWYNYLHPNA